MKRTLPIIVTLLALNSIRAGVHVTAEFPACTKEQINNLVTANRDLLRSGIENFNAQNGTDTWCYEDSPWLDKVTLGFVDTSGSKEDILKKYPGIIEMLLKVSTKHVSALLNVSPQGVQMEYFDGKFKVMCDGSEKTNYITAVLKLVNDADIAKIAETISQKLKKKYQIKQAFSFSGHITLGKVFGKGNQPLPSNLRDHLKNHKSIVPESFDMEINEFKLRCHDGSEETFKLKDRA